MIEKLKIRLADWRDREFIQPLRRKLGRPVDGGLYELLNWPTHHAHIAMDGATPAGFTSVLLNMSGDADDIGTVVHEEYRRHGIASELRYTQIRDLALMGYARLFCAAPSDDEAAVAACHAHFGAPIAEINSAYIPKHFYFGSSLTAIEDRLMAMGIRRPFPLSPLNQERLLSKLERAKKEATSIRALGDFNLRKAYIRDEN